MKNALYIVAALMVLLGWQKWEDREFTHPAGVLVSSVPKQQPVSGSEVLLLEDYRLARRAVFEIESRVLSRKKYWWGDESDLSPLDLALGWGVMSDQSVLDRIEIRQSGRWYFTRYDHPAPASDHEIINNSSNMHIIPADNRVWSKLKQLRRGSIVRLKGYLVDVSNESGFHWQTSLRRDDTGNGSCEIFYVEQIQIL